jgi:hypothetical protein
MKFGRVSIFIEVHDGFVQVTEWGKEANLDEFKNPNKN